jgi:hypothetical protein
MTGSQMDQQSEESKDRPGKIQNKLRKIVRMVYSFFQSKMPGGHRTPGWSFLRDQSAPYWYM